jgi:uncharacterized protein involved in propanediol utilization
MTQHLLLCEGIIYAHFGDRNHIGGVYEPTEQYLTLPLTSFLCLTLETISLSMDSSSVLNAEKECQKKTLRFTVTMHFALGIALHVLSGCKICSITELRRHREPQNP